MPEDETEIDKLRRQHGEQLGLLSASHRRLRETVWFVVTGNVLGVALLVLTATDWTAVGSPVSRVTRNAWRHADALGLWGWLQLGPVLALAVAALAVSVVDRMPARVYRTVGVLAALTGLWLSFYAATAGGTTRTLPGYWMSVLAAAGLAVVHLSRASSSRPA